MQDIEMKGPRLFIGSTDRRLHLRVTGPDGTPEGLCESLRGERHYKLSDRAQESERREAGHGIVTCERCRALAGYEPLPEQRAEVLQRNAYKRLVAAR
jgi:hypothetical protein